MAAISWSGGTLRNVWATGPGSDQTGGRFNAYAPASRVIGQRRTLLATGAPRVWAYRTDHTAAFELRDIATDAVALCLALAEHLSGGGTVDVETGDSGGRVYIGCFLAPESEEPQPKQDPESGWWTMTFTLATPGGAPFVMVYD